MLGEETSARFTPASCKMRRCTIRPLFLTCLILFPAGSRGISYQSWSFATLGTSSSSLAICISDEQQRTLAFRNHHSVSRYDCSKRSLA